MTEWTRAPLDEIRQLADERGRYEGWLSALAERRESTPARVYERVRQDYDGRLHRVLTALATHADVLRDDATALAARHEEAVRLLDEQRDALAEIELRALVGEYDEAHAARMRAEAEQVIGEREGEAGRMDAELREVRALLERATPVDDRPNALAASPPGRAAGEQGAAGTLADEERREMSALPSAGAVGSQLPPSDDGWRARDVAVDARTGFDSFAPPATVRRDTPPQSAPAFAGQGLADAAFDVGARPAGASAADTPEGVAAQKTLRCQDCGEMNYPTEWYCERCGGELAAL